MWNKTSDGYTFSPTTAGIYYNLTGFVCGDNDNVYCDIKPALNYLTVIYPGFYSVSLHISGHGTVAGGLYGVSVAKNFNEALTRNCYVNLESTTAAEVLSIDCIIWLNKGDSVSVKIEDEAAPPKNFIIHTSNLNIKYIGGYSV